MNSATLNNRLQLTTNRLVRSVERARVLFTHIVENGGHESNGTWHRFMQHDKRDVTQFLFLETAAAWEYYAKEVFVLAIQDQYGISPQKAKYVVGHPDQGLTRLSGWGDPRLLKDRCKNYFGANYILSRIGSINGNNTCYVRLGYAHKIRNHIAHDGTSDKYNSVLKAVVANAANRRGLGPGRFLLDYPLTSNDNDKWFHRLIGNYETVANNWRANL